MPIIASAKKALRQSLKRADQNRVVKTRVKTIVDKVTATKEKGLLPEAFSIIDRAVKRNIIHKNKAGHVKSQLAKIVAGTATTVSKVTKKVKKTSSVKKTTKKVTKKSTKKTAPRK